MAGRVIQGFFLGGAPRTPVATPAASAPGAAARATIGAPRPAFAGHNAALQRRSAPGRHSSAPVPATVAQPFRGGGSFEIDPVQVGLASGGGKPLPAPLLAKMEAAFQADFSAVRVHVGPQASRIGAVAFTTGNDLYFSFGQFRPDSIQGQQLIGHELAHVVQQRQGRVRARGQGIEVVQDRALEAEADRLGMRAAAQRMPLQAKPAGPFAATVALRTGGVTAAGARGFPFGQTAGVAAQRRNAGTVQRAAAAAPAASAVISPTPGGGVITVTGPGPVPPKDGEITATFGKTEAKTGNFKQKSSHAEYKMCVIFLEQRDKEKKRNRGKPLEMDGWVMSVNAWPCLDCDKFLGATATAANLQIKVDITEDGGLYSSVHGVEKYDIGSILYKPKVKG